jgi:hypothetical protein
MFDWGNWVLDIINTLAAIVRLVATLKRHLNNEETYSSDINIFSDKPSIC